MYIIAVTNTVGLVCGRCRGSNSRRLRLFRRFIQLSFERCQRGHHPLRVCTTSGHMMIPDIPTRLNCTCTPRIRIGVFHCTCCRSRCADDSVSHPKHPIVFLCCGFGHLCAVAYQCARRGGGYAKRSDVIPKTSKRVQRDQLSVDALVVGLAFDIANAEAAAASTAAFAGHSHSDSILPQSSQNRV